MNIRGSLKPSNEYLNLFEILSESKYFWIWINSLRIIRISEYIRICSATHNISASALDSWTEGWIKYIILLRLEQINNTRNISDSLMDSWDCFTFSKSWDQYFYKIQPLCELINLIWKLLSWFFPIGTELACHAVIMNCAQHFARHTSSKQPCF